MKFNIESTTSYNSISPVYLYTERSSNHVESYHKGTQWFGVLLAFISGAFFTVSSSLVKAIKNVDPMVLLGIRAILQMIVMAVAGCYNSKNLFGPKGQRFLIQFQGLIGGTTLALLYYSFRKLPLGDATTIIFSSPVIVIALSFLFLKEPCGLLRIIVICTLLLGVTLVAKPPFIFQVNRSTPYDVMGYVYAILATLFTALNIVVMRKCIDVHYSSLVFILSAWTLVIAMIFSLATSGHQVWRIELPHDWLDWGKICAVASSGLAGQVLVAIALKIEEAGKVSVTRSLDIILAYIVQIYCFGEMPNQANIVGAVLVLASVICMGFEKEIYGVCDMIP